MPVTIKPSPSVVGHHSDPAYTTSSDFYKAHFKAATTDDRGYPCRPFSHKPPRPVLHSSFANLDRSTEQVKITPHKNGFVNGVIRAFQQDCHLTIRPDDVWLAILTQFSFYVNAHAEELRDKLVNHDGQAHLVARTENPFTGPNVAALAEKLVRMMQKKMAEGVAEWLVPTFSTTTKNDKAVASMVMMATMKKFFSFGMRFGCGFPSVTLLGEREDYEAILSRLDKFAEYGDEPAHWSKLLRAVIKRFVATFDDPESQELKEFWEQAMSSLGKLGSGSHEIAPYNGWLTAFMFWDDEGKMRRRSGLETDANEQPPLELDGVAFPFLRYVREGVPSGVIEVPVEVEDVAHGLKYQTTIVAGSVGVRVGDGPEGEKDAMVQPCSGWWMLEDSRRPLN